MKTRSAKNKGNKLTKLVRNQILNYLPIFPYDIKITISGELGIDVRLFSKEAKEIFPFGVECKNQETVHLWTWWEQTTVNAEKEKLKPLLVISKNRNKEPLAVLKLTDLLEILKNVKIE